MNLVRASLALALAASLALAAGCVGQDDASGDAATPPPASEPPAATPPPSGGNGNPGGAPSTGSPATPAPAPPAPEPVTVEESGTIQGPFQKSWAWNVDSPAFSDFTVSFALAGTGGLPAPLAQVTLELYDAAGTLVKSATLGPGGSGDAVAWTLAATDVAATGEWSLRVAGNPASEGDEVPSLGFADYALTVTVTY